MSGRRRMLRMLLATGIAVGGGVAIALTDSAPGFDATGMTVVGLIGVGLLTSLVAGSRNVLVAVGFGLLVGIWVPMLELGGSSGNASLAALAFGVAGALIGAVTLRLMQSGGLTVR